MCDPLVAFSCLVASSQQKLEITHLADLPPPTFGVDQNTKWNNVDILLEKYWSPGDGFETHSSSSKQHELTYGEVTSLGVRQLAFEMGIVVDTNTVSSHSDDNNSTNSKELSDDIVFFDLGSGVGRLVTQIYFDQPHRVKKAIGVELASDRHKIGIMALQGIRQEMDFAKSEIFDEINDKDSNFSSFLESVLPIELIHGDALQVDLYTENATHVFISSLCFPEEVLNALQQKLLKVPTIQFVAALNRLALFAQRDDIWHEREIPIQMSWGPSVAKIYTKMTQ